MSSLPQTIDTIPLTGDELFERGDLGPCELIAGRIIPMTPAGGPHGFIELNVAYELKRLLTKINLVGYKLAKLVFTPAATRTLFEGLR